MSQYFMQGVALALYYDLKCISPEKFKQSEHCTLQKNIYVYGRPSLSPFLLSG